MGTCFFLISKISMIHTGGLSHDQEGDWASAGAVAPSIAQAGEEAVSMETEDVAAADADAIAVAGAEAMTVAGAEAMTVAGSDDYAPAEDAVQADEELSLHLSEDESNDACDSHVSNYSFQVLT